MVYVIYITNLGRVNGLKWGVSDHQQAPHTEHLLISSKGFEQERLPNKDSGGFDTQLF